MIRVNWINFSKGKPADERGFYRSIEGRFNISPNYRHTVYPDSYDLQDTVRKTKISFNTIRECKELANRLVNEEINHEKELVGAE